MSSILKALKKLEQETAENAGTPLTAGINGRPIKQPGKRPGSLVVPGLIACTLCIFAGVGILIYTQNASVSESTAVLEKEEKPVSAEKISVKNISGPKTAAAVPKFEFSTAGTSITDKQVLDVQKLPDAPPPETLPEMELQANLPGFEYAMASGKTTDPFSSINPEPDVVNKNSALTEEDPETTAAFQPEVVADESSVPDLPDMRNYAFTDKPVAKKAELSVAVIKDSSVELQAISWSADPEKRLAIINGKICREKDHVGGYMIQAIKPDEVILTKGSVKGKLVFEIR